MGREEKIHLIVCDSNHSNLSPMKIFKNLRKKFSIPKDKVGKHLKSYSKLKNSSLHCKAKNKFKRSEASLIFNKSQSKNGKQTSPKYNNLVSFKIMSSSNSSCSSLPASLENLKNIDESCMKSSNEFLDISFRDIKFDNFSQNNSLSESTTKDLLNERQNPSLKLLKKIPILIETDLKNIKVSNSSGSCSVPLKPKGSTATGNDFPIDCYVSLSDENTLKFKSRIHLNCRSPPKERVSLLLKSILEEADVNRGARLCRRNYLKGCVRQPKRKRWHSETNGYVCDIEFRQNSTCVESDKSNEFKNLRFNEAQQPSGSGHILVRPKNLKITPSTAVESKVFSRLELDTSNECIWDVDDCLPKREKVFIHTEGKREVFRINAKFKEENRAEKDPCSQPISPQLEDKMSNECTQLVEVKYVQLSMSIVLALVLHAVQSISQLMLEVFLVTEPHSPPW